MATRSSAPDPLAKHMPAVARALLGKPNANHSVPNNPRWGNNGSLSVDEKLGIWFDHEAKDGGGVLDLIRVRHGLTGDDAFDWMKSIGCRIDGPTRTNGAKTNGATHSAAQSDDAKKQIAETYDYVDENGERSFQVVRFVFRQPDGSLVLSGSGKPKKTFHQRRPDPDNPKTWVWGLSAGEYMRKASGQDWYRFDDARWARLPASRERKTIAAPAKSVPYRLPDVIEAVSQDRTVFVVEGEQKADALAKWNLVATCNAEGAGKWTAKHVACLRGADVVILPDNDDPGRAHAETVAQSLSGIASRVRILELPELPAKADIVDWQKAGGTREQLDALVAGAPDWRKVDKPDDTATDTSAAPTTKRQQHGTYRVTSAKELNVMRFDPIKWVVPDIIVEGLTLLAAKPKMGKSWMMLHAAIAVASGGFTLGEIHCPEGDVLYCALEDNLRRLQSRMTKLLGTRPWPERLGFRCEMPRLVDGGLNQIREWIKAANCPRLVIIDTLAMVRAPKKREESTYDADYAAVKDLRTLANECGVAIMLVHHLRKQESDDAFDTISGTLGLTGAPDSILVLRRDSTGSIILHGRGRDLIEVEKALTFNNDACTWTIAGEVREVRSSNQRRDILAAMRDIELPAKPADIAAAANLKQGSVRHLLRRMVDDGTLMKCDYGKYDLLHTEERT